jgi:hypothetical protein
MNAVLNGTVQYCAWSRVLLHCWPCDATPEQLCWLDSNLRIALLGDDSLTLAPIRDYFGNLWQEEELTYWISTFGFETKLTSTDDVYKAVFLGNRPYPIEGGVAWGPTIGRRVYKHHTVQTKKISDFHAWLKGVTTAELVNFAHVPILNDIAIKTAEILHGHSETPYEPDSNKFVLMRAAPLRPASFQAQMDCLARVYGITLSEYQAFLALLSQVQTLPAQLLCAAIDRVLAFDEK